MRGEISRVESQGSKRGLRVILGSTLVYLKRRGPQSRYYQRLLSPRIGMILPVSSRGGILGLDKGRQGVID